jgi:hypothetical protein
VVHALTIWPPTPENRASDAPGATLAGCGDMNVGGSASGAHAVVAVTSEGVDDLVELAARRATGCQPLVAAEGQPGETTSRGNGASIAAYHSELPMRTPSASDSFEYLAVVVEFTPADDQDYAAYELHAEPITQHEVPLARRSAVRVDFDAQEEAFFAAGDALAHAPDPVAETFEDEPAAAPPVPTARPMWRRVPTT